MDIDHVYTWVNPDDRELSRLRATYSGAQVSEDHDYVAGPARVRDNGELRLSLMTAARFMPFIRRTYIIGSGAAPDWLPEFGQKLIYVDQNEIIPAEYAPLFQSDAVEAFIYRTPGLSEHYVYSNDDYFFARTHQPFDLFDGRGRARVGIARWPVAVGPHGTYRVAEENSLRALTNHLEPPRFASSLPSLFSDKRLRMHRLAVKRWVSLRMRRLPRVNAISHVSQPFLKSGWEEFHGVFRNELVALFSNRFRSQQSVAVNFLYLQFLRYQGRANFQIASHDRLLNRYASARAREKLRRELLAPDCTIQRFCLNDTPVEREDGWREYVAGLVGDLLGEPSR